MLTSAREHIRPLERRCWYVYTGNPASRYDAIATAEREARDALRGPVGSALLWRHSIGAALDGLRRTETAARGSHQAAVAMFNSKNACDTITFEPVWNHNRAPRWPVGRRFNPTR